MKIVNKPSSPATLKHMPVKLVGDVSKSSLYGAVSVVLNVGGTELAIDNFWMTPDVLCKWAIAKGRLPTKIYDVKRSASAVLYDFFWKDCNTQRQKLHLSDLGSELYGRSYKADNAGSSRDGSAEWLGVKPNGFAINSFLDHSRRNFALCGRTSDGIAMAFGDIYWPDKPAPVVSADAAILCLNHVAALGAYGDVSGLVTALDGCGIEGEIERGHSVTRGIIVVNAPTCRDDAVAIATLMACGVIVFGESAEIYAGADSPLRKHGVWAPVQVDNFFDRDERDLPATSTARLALQCEGASSAAVKSAEWLMRQIQAGNLTVEMEVRDA